MNWRDKELLVGVYKEGSIQIYEHTNYRIMTHDLQIYKHTNYRFINTQTTGL